MDGILIRPILEKDLFAIVNLLRQLTDHAHSTFEMDIDHVRLVYSKMINSPQSYKNLVACKNEVVVGFISVVYYLSFFHQGGTALINELIVAADHRNLGIGKALVQHSISTARQDGMDEIEVGTERGNKPAAAFYRNARFDEEYTLLGMEFDLETDCHPMADSTSSK
jgi:ribosomal protein S18 acetylase RimI-like enzyme